MGDLKFPADKLVLIGNCRDKVSQSIKSLVVIKLFIGAIVILLSILGIAIYFDRSYNGITENSIYSFYVILAGVCLVILLNWLVIPVFKMELITASNLLTEIETIASGKDVPDKKQSGEGFVDESLDQIVIDLDSNKPIETPIYVYHHDDIVNHKINIKNLNFMFNKYGIEKVNFSIYYNINPFEKINNQEAILRLNDPFFSKIFPSGEVRFDSPEFKKEKRPKVKRVEFTQKPIYRHPVYVIDINSLRRIIKDTLRDADEHFMIEKYYNDVLIESFFIHKDQLWENVKEEYLKQQNEDTKE